MRANSISVSRSNGCARICRFVSPKPGATAPAFRSQPWSTTFMPRSRNWAASAGTHRACWRGWSAERGEAGDSLRRPLYRTRLNGAKTPDEERQYLVACGDGRLACLVDQMGGHHTVRAVHVARKERGGVGIRGTVWKYPPDEAVAQRVGIGREPLS